MLPTAGVVSDEAEDALREIKRDPPPHITPRILSRLLLIRERCGDDGKNE